MATASRRRETRRPRTPAFYDAFPAGTDFRAHPERYRVGRGEQGVLMVEPYKSEILPHWRFRTPAVARESADAILKLFRRYQCRGDFVGMDIARKFLQMGYTRARRYANYAGGRKYDAAGRAKPRGNDATKAAAARVFYKRWREVAADEDYMRRKREHVARYG
jgi:hypothetical protein